MNLCRVKPKKGAAGNVADPPPEVLLLVSPLLSEFEDLRREQVSDLAFARDDNGQGSDLVDCLRRGVAVVKFQGFQHPCCHPEILALVEQVVPIRVQRNFTINTGKRRKFLYLVVAAYQADVTRDSYFRFFPRSQLELLVGRHRPRLKVQPEKP